MFNLLSKRCMNYIFLVIYKYVSKKIFLKRKIFLNLRVTKRNIAYFSKNNNEKYYYYVIILNELV